MKKDKKAVTLDTVYKGVKVTGIEGKEQLSVAINEMMPDSLRLNDVIFLCIGTDRSTGDSLAPFVGTYLEGLGYENVYGTIDNPVHAVNLTETAEKFDKSKTIIAIDACLGGSNSVGKFGLIQGGIKAGAGVGRDLPVYGDYGIYGVVNVSGFMEYEVLQNTRLSRVIKMSKDITSSIIERFPLSDLDNETDNRVDKKYKIVINKKTVYKNLKRKGMRVEYIK